MPAPSPISVARALAPGISARAAEIEEARRLPADLARDMAAAGLFRTLVARDMGGSELSPSEFVAVVETIAAADASVGWCLMIGATTALTTAWLPQPVAREILADPATITAGVFAPTGKADVEGADYRVTGRWAWASGSANAQWLFGNSLIFDGGAMRLLPDGRPDARMLLFARADVELIDSWHASGLKGTGSGDIAVADLLVPNERSISLVTDRPLADGALFAFPVFGLLALGIAAVASGNARAALDTVQQAMTSRRPQGSAKSSAERPTVQTEIARTEAALSAARALLADSIGNAWDAANRNGEIDLQARARLRLAATHMVRTAADVTRTAYDLGGGASVYLESPLQRRFRDAHAMTQHMMVQPQTYELVGRVLLGLPTSAAML